MLPTIAEVIGVVSAAQAHRAGRTLEVSMGGAPSANRTFACRL
jgi:hypothetical protein